MSFIYQNPSDFPGRFSGIFITSVKTYKNSFVNYLLLAVITYLPFLIIIQLGTLDTLDIVEFFHGHFLDIIIFLTLPTWFFDKKVLPLATISLFIQRFFASAVVLSFIQLGTLLFSITFFAQISLGIILIGIIPYIFLLFAGFFLIMENSSKLISIKDNLLNSIKLVRGQFFSIFWNYINITILMFLPIFLFSLWYLGKHPDLVIIRDTFNSGNPEKDLVIGQTFLKTVQRIVQEPGFMWSRIGIHIIFRPLKSLFLCFLFLSIVQKIYPNIINSFLGAGPQPENDKTAEAKTSSGNMKNNDDLSDGS